MSVVNISLYLATGVMVISLLIVWLAQREDTDSETSLSVRRKLMLALLVAITILLPFIVIVAITLIADKWIGNLSTSKWIGLGGGLLLFLIIFFAVHHFKRKVK